MNGDFSRITFDADAQFSQVLLQQGRVLLDADFNEQSAIHQHFLRTLIMDVVGRACRAGDGFTVAPNGSEEDDFLISAGRFYLDGIMCVAPEGTTFRNQPSWPVPTGEGLGGEPFVAVIEAWERLVTATQLPDLRELALGGADTASRAQIRWQVRPGSAEWFTRETELMRKALQARFDATENVEARAAIKTKLDAAAKALQTFTDALNNFATTNAKPNCDAAMALLDALDGARPLLRASGKQDNDDQDPCAIAADAQYRGRENQLYRVEVHTGGLAGEATLKWSRENASVAFRMRQPPLLTGSNLVVSLETLGRDRRTGLCLGDWVELTGDRVEFAGLARPLGQVTKIDRAHGSVSVKMHDAPTASAFADCTLLRRWDQQVDVDDSGTVPITEGGDTWIPLERGIRVQFLPGGNYRSGDYWLIPARVASGDVLWPRDGEVPRAREPDGVKRHRAALAFGKKKAGAWVFRPCGGSITPICK